MGNFYFKQEKILPLMGSISLQIAQAILVNRMNSTKKNLQYNPAKTEYPVHNVITHQRCNMLGCYQPSAIGFYDTLHVVYFNMDFITFCFMTGMVFVWLLVKHENDKRTKTEMKIQNFHTSYIRKIAEKLDVNRPAGTNINP